MSRLWHYKRTEYEGELLWHKGFQRREYLQLPKIGLAYSGMQVFSFH